MKGRARNSAFFQQNDGDMVKGGRPMGGRAGNSNNIKSLLKAGRSTGSIALTEKRLVGIPAEIYTAEQDLEEGEKFWEIQPIVKLDLSNNEIQEIPDDISTLANLTTFKIRNNKVEAVSRALFTACVGLVHLDLSSNSIRELDDAVGQLGFLSELYLSGNNLRSLPESICDCARLTAVEAADNQLESIPTNIGRLRHLNRVNFANNKLSFIPESLCCIASLQDFNIKKNRLVVLPDMSSMVALTVFDATDNRIDMYPTFAPPVNNKLARVYLGGNRLTVLPSAVLSAGESALVELDVQGNQLNEISPDIGILKNLKLLNASNNNLTDIPYTLGYMASLQRLVLDGNPLRTIRRSLLTQSTADLKKYLRTRGPEPDYVKKQEAAFHFADIDPFDERMREMSGGVLNCAALKLISLPSDFSTKLMRATSIDSTEVSLRLVHLNLSNNKFTELPKEIIDLSTLQVLDMSGNLLGQSHPADVIQNIQQFPPGLHVLNVNKNGLSTEHVEYLISVAAKSVVGGVDFHQASSAKSSYPPGLQSLLCSENRMTTLPRNLADLANSVRELQVSFNSLTSVTSTDFRVFERLEIFDASNNKLRSLGNLPTALCLTDVLLSNNDIAEIPLEFGRLKMIRNFSVLGNPQKTVRLHVVQQGTDAILKVLRMRLPEDTAGTVIEKPFVRSAQAAVEPECREENLSVIPARSRIGRAANDLAHLPAPAARSSTSAGGFTPPAAQDRCENPRSSSHGGASMTLRDAVHGSYDIEKKISDLDAQFQEVSATLDDPGMSEAKRFASKKNLAKIRANILRLNREKDAATSARYS